MRDFAYRIVLFYELSVCRGILMYNWLRARIRAFQDERMCRQRMKMYREIEEKRRPQCSMDYGFRAKQWATYYMDPELVWDLDHDENSRKFLEQFDDETLKAIRQVEQGKLKEAKAYVDPGLHYKVIKDSKGGYMHFVGCVRIPPKSMLP